MSPVCPHTSTRPQVSLVAHSTSYELALYLLKANGVHGAEGESLYRSQGFVEDAPPVHAKDNLFYVSAPS